MAMAKAAAAAALMALFFVVVVPAAAAHAQQQCNAWVLEAYCESAFNTGAAPTVPCCDALSAQEHCFCQFARDPLWGDYFRRTGVQATILACGLLFPINC